MEVINIIDSLELNGGSTTFLEMVAGMQKYWEHDIKSYVVSKTGKFGRKGLIDGFRRKMLNSQVQKQKKLMRKE